MVATPALRKHEAARSDLLEHFDYLEEQASLIVAQQFLNNAEASFETLTLQPRIGSPLELRHRELKGVRKWAVRDFPNHLIFYLPEPDAVYIVRVLHSTSDWWATLGIE